MVIAGAFGTAVLHKRLSDGKLVVLKEIGLTELSAPERQMALNEVQVLSVLHHPNIIRYTLFLLNLIFTIVARQIYSYVLFFLPPIDK